SSDLLKSIAYSRPILLLVTKDEVSIVLPTLEENHAKHKTDADHLYVYHEVEGKDGEHSYHAQVETLLTTIDKGSHVGIEYNSLSTQITLMLKEAGLDYANIEKEIVQMRAVKSEEEIKMIKESGKLVSHALKESVENVKSGMSELEMDYFGNEDLFKSVTKSYTDSTFNTFIMS